MLWRNFSLAGWPLSENFGFEVETKETPPSKVVVLMPQVTAIIKA
jgi:hypothetical protein